MNILSLLTIFFAFSGFLLAFYIHHKKRSKEKMLCPLNSDCDTVIYSQYSKFWGMPVQILGLVYYGAIALSYASFVAVPSLVLPTVVFIILGITIVAFLFSAYLTFIQAFNLKQWCTWCLISAGICTGIFILSIANSEYNLNFLLTEHSGFILTLHLIGMALGLGGATMTDILFFKFLKDLRISESENEVLHTLSQVIWFALAMLILSGIGLYLPNADYLNYSPKFLAKMIVVLAILINGSLLNLIISPQLLKISFGEKHDHETGELRRLRRLAFALGSISLVSWYTAFALGIMKAVNLSFSGLLILYGILLLVGVAISQLMEYLFYSKVPRKPGL